MLPRSVTQSSLTLVAPWTVTHQAPLSVGFSRQEYCSERPFPPPWDLPNPGIKPVSLMSPAWQTGSLPLAPPGKHQKSFSLSKKKILPVPLCLPNYLRVLKKLPHTQRHLLSPFFLLPAVRLLGTSSSIYSLPSETSRHLSSHSDKTHSNSRAWKVCEWELASPTSCCGPG